MGDDRWYHLTLRDDGNLTELLEDVVKGADLAETVDEMWAWATYNVEDDAAVLVLDVRHALTADAIPKPRDEQLDSGEARE